MTRPPTAALLALLAVSCARGDAGPVAHPTGPDDVVLRVETGSVGFMHPMEVMNPHAPALTLYGDGRLILDRAGGTGRFVTAYTVARLSEGGVQRILGAARDAGLLGGDRRLDAAAGTDGDGTTYVTVVAEGAEHVTSAWNLSGTGPDEEDLDGGTVRGREDLRRFLALLDDLPGWLGDAMLFGPEAFEPEGWAAVWAVARDPRDDGPWSGDMVAEFRVRPWPLAPLADAGEPVDDAGAIRCSLLRGEELAALREHLNEDSLWDSEGVIYHVYVRPLLPDERRCADVA